jgi:hypothetical protein
VPAIELSSRFGLPSIDPHHVTLADLLEVAGEKPTVVGPIVVNDSPWYPNVLKKGLRRSQIHPRGDQPLDGSECVNHEQRINPADGISCAAGHADLRLEGPDGISVLCGSNPNSPRGRNHTSHVDDWTGPPIAVRVTESRSCQNSASGMYLHRMFVRLSPLTCS